MSQIVTDEHGQQHEFPDEATPEMMMQALAPAPSPRRGPWTGIGQGATDMLIGLGQRGIEAREMLGIPSSVSSERARDIVKGRESDIAASRGPNAGFSALDDVPRPFATDRRGDAEHLACFDAALAESDQHIRRALADAGPWYPTRRGGRRKRLHHHLRRRLIGELMLLSVLVGDDLTHSGTSLPPCMRHFFGEPGVADIPGPGGGPAGAVDAPAACDHRCTAGSFARRSRLFARCMASYVAVSVGIVLRMSIMSLARASSALMLARFTASLARMVCGSSDADAARPCTIFMSRSLNPDAGIPPLPAPMKLRMSRFTSDLNDWKSWTFSGTFWPVAA